MKNFKPVIYTGMIVLFFVVVIAISNATASVDYLTKIDYSTYEKISNNGDVNIVYIGRPSCSYCQKYMPILNDIITEYPELKINYLNTEDLTTDEISKLDKSNTYLSSGEWGTPQTLLIKNNEVIDYINGYVAKDEVLSFLRKNEIIPNVNGLISITYETYLQLINNGSKNIIYIGRPSCGYCAKYQPILEEVLNEREEIVVNYLNLDTLTDEENAALVNSLDYLKNEVWGTPLTILVQDKNIIDLIDGAVEKEDIISFLEKNELE